MARKQQKRAAKEQEFDDASSLPSDAEFADYEEESGAEGAESRLFDPEALPSQDMSGAESGSDEADEDEETEDALEMMAAMQAMRDMEVAEGKRETIDNHDALQRLEGEMKLDHLPWVETQAVTSTEAVNPDDVHDDLKRELAFYTQALEAAEIGLQQLRKAGVPTTRPSDYFAEMVKTDAHMEKIRRKLLDERTKIVASEDARRQRELKKFGKKVQQEKLLERQKAKSTELDRIKTLKKKRKGNELTDDHEEDFDVAVEKASSGAGSKGGQEKNTKRRRKDAKFGFGGKKRNSKSNTASSTDDMSGYNGRKMKQGFAGVKSKRTAGVKARPGKARRQKARM